MRQMTVVVASAVAASGIALCGYWLGHVRASRALSQPRSTDNGDTSAREDGNDKLTGTIEHLERRLAQLEIKQALSKPAQAAAPAAPLAASERERFDPAKEEERRLERAAAIEATLRTEARDRDWASPTESQLQAAVETAVKAGAKFSLKTLKCFTSICDMVLSASAPEDLNHISEQLASQITGMSSVDLSPPATGADGRAAVTCRLFRQGYPRPDEGLM